MEGIIRVIKTFFPCLGESGGPAYVYVFCLPPAAMGRIDEILAHMRHMTPQGVSQSDKDDAGLVIYKRRGADEAQTCLAVLSVINLVCPTGLKFDPSATGSVFYSMTYGPGKGATTYAELQQDPGFRLPYMASQSS